MAAPVNCRESHDSDRFAAGLFRNSMETRCTNSARSSSSSGWTRCRAGGVLTHGSKPVAVATRAESGQTRGGGAGFRRHEHHRCGTVTYNDGKRVLAFGHPLFNLGPVDMPMAKDDMIFTLASAYQPNKMGNATEIVGALHQDRHSGIMGELGATSPDDSGDAEGPLAGRQRTRCAGEGFPLQRVRAPEVDAVPDDADAVQLASRTSTTSPTRPPIA